MFLIAFSYLQKLHSRHTFFMAFLYLQFARYAFPVTLNIFDPVLMINMLFLRVEQNPGITR